MLFRSRLPKTLTLSLLATIFVGVPVLAQTGSGVMTDAHIAKIRTNCHAAQITLERIHANDAPAYINRNQTYFSISDKLMARLNSRLTLNRYDATELVKTASDYNSGLTEFRTAYKAYDDAMSSALKINCTKEPVGFYDRVTTAREARQNVKDAADNLTALIEQYRQQVQQFEDEHFSSKTARSGR